MHFHINQKTKFKGIIQGSDIVVSGLLSFLIVASEPYSSNGHFSFAVIDVLKVILTWAVLLFLFTLIKELPLTSSQSKVKLLPFVPPPVNAYFLPDKSQIKKNLFLLPTLRIGLLIFAVWIPALICFFPGNLPGDTLAQLNMFAQLPDTTNITDHHPFFDTLLFGSWIYGIASISGSFSFALFFLVLIQAIFTAFSFGYIIATLHYELALSSRYILATFTFFALNPIFPVSCAYVVKDSVFSICFTFFFVTYLRIIKNPSLLTGTFTIRFIIVCILTSLTKKAGVFIVLPSLLFLLIVRKNSPLAPLLCFLSTALVCCAIIPTIYNAVGITPGERKEALSHLMQQTARYVTDYEYDVSAEEKQAIDNLLEYDTLAERYRYNHADYVKGAASGATDEEYQAWLKVWLRQGLRHPKAYFNASVSMVSGWFCFDPYSPIFDSSFLDKRNYFESSSVPHSIIERPALFDWSSHAYKRFYRLLCKVPLLNIFFSVCLYASIIPAYCLARLINLKNKRYLVFMVPIACAIVFGMWLAPTYLGANGSRYVQPLIYVAPLILAWAIYLFPSHGRIIEQ